MQTAKMKVLRNTDMLLYCNSLFYIAHVPKSPAIGFFISLRQGWVEWHYREKSALFIILLQHKGKIASHSKDTQHKYI